MDDVEATLADLEARLRALQAELDDDADPPRADPSRAECRVACAERTQLDTRPAGGDPLDAFGERLRRTAAELVAAYDDVVGKVRGGSEPLDGDVAVEARADLPGLCALARALGAIPGVHGVELRAYAGGHAALEVALDRPVALVESLRAGFGPKFGVLEARPGRLVLEVGTPEEAQETSRG